MFVLFRTLTRRLVNTACRPPVVQCKRKNVLLSFYSSFSSTLPSEQQLFCARLSLCIFPEALFLAGLDLLLFGVVKFNVIPLCFLYMHATFTTLYFRVCFLIRSTKGGRECRSTEQSAQTTCMFVKYFNSVHMGSFIVLHVPLHPCQFCVVYINLCQHIFSGI